MVPRPELNWDQRFSPLFAIFAALAILEIANPFKKASKGVGRALEIPAEFISSFVNTSLMLLARVLPSL